ncbi:hypothetical protein D9757_012215 [Collybiopsis confluens]|uniref:Uncharacterized protein n=1 Tax=Collybiopsis confluens TaxID=2823264 RepID=A0A8H5GLM5_9AGAR|nr:hypothetical protein D9757_012215 [Collybiopsis confluens]
MRTFVLCLLSALLCFLSGDGLVVGVASATAATASSDPAASSTVSSSSSSSNPILIETIHSFGLNISLENLAVRHSGEIIVGFDNAPILYQVDPKVNGSTKFIHLFNDYFDIHGITEVKRDQFYVVVGNLSLVTHIAVPGHGAVYHVDMSCFPEKVEVNKVANFNESMILNGMTVFDRERGLVYIADSRVGVVNILNVYTGKHSVAINDTLTNQPPNATDTSKCIDSVHVVEIDECKYLYFSNFVKGLIGRVALDEDGYAKGAAEIVIDGLNAPEDFILDKEGKYIYLALFKANEIIRIDIATKAIKVLAGSPDSSTYKWAVAVEFGRRERDKDDLYFTINGGFLEPDNVGGTVFRIPNVSDIPDY